MHIYTAEVTERKWPTLGRYDDKDKEATNVSWINDPTRDFKSYVFKELGKVSLHETDRSTVHFTGKAGGLHRPVLKMEYIARK